MGEICGPQKKFQILPLEMVKLMVMKPAQQKKISLNSILDKANFGMKGKFSYVIIFNKNL